MPRTRTRPWAPPAKVRALDTSAVAGSMKVTPSAVATAMRGRSTISSPASEPSTMASSILVRVSALPGEPRTTGAPRIDGALDGGQVGPRVARGQDGQGIGEGRRIGDVGRHHGQRGAGPGRRQVGDRRQVQRAERLPGRGVQGRDPLGRGGHDGQAIVADQQVVHRMADGTEVGRLQTDVHPAQPDGGQVHDPDAAVVVAHHQAVVGHVDGQGAGARGGHHRHRPAGGQVLGPDHLAGRDVHAATGQPVSQRIVPAALHGGRPDRVAELAGGAHVVLAEGDEPDGHGVLGQVRVGPLVDVVATGRSASACRNSVAVRAW